MQADPYTRAILTFIALCLLVIVARGIGAGEPEAPPPPAAESGPWTLQMMRTGLGGPPTLLRLNTATGEVWSLRVGANQEWARMGEVTEAAEAPAAAPPAPPATPPPAPAPEAAPEP
jgi:hypothetical protein